MPSIGGRRWQRAAWREVIGTRYSLRTGCGLSAGLGMAELATRAAARDSGASIMRLIIAGSRTIAGAEALAAIDSLAPRR